MSRVSKTISLLIFIFPICLFAQEESSDISVLELRAGKAYIDIGKDEGVVRGDEYTLRDAKADPEREDLLIIEDVKDEISVATVVYSSDALAIGSTVKQLEKAGLDSALKTQVIVGTESVAWVLDYRQSINRWFFTYRPFVGAQVMLIPHVKNTLDPVDLHFDILIGGEVNWYLGRIQVVPAIAGGIALAIPLNSEEAFHFSHAGGSAEIQVLYLFNRKWKAGITVGFTSWISLPDVSEESFIGIAMGISGSVKY